MVAPDRFNVSHKLFYTLVMAATSGHWETIRPWTDRISLQVKELTSVSVTFVLTSAVASADEAVPLLVEHLEAPDELLCRRTAFMYHARVAVWRTRR